MGTQAKTSMDKELHAYTKRLHLVGTVTMLAVLVLTFCPALYIFAAYKSFPGWRTVAAVFGALFAHEVWTWVMEPVMYFPMIGIAGAYICFTAGNIISMRIPCAIAAQNAVDARNGTPKGDAASVFAMVASVVVNFAALAVVIVFGNYLLAVLPETVKVAFNYTMPAVYGALLVMMTGMISGIVGKKK